MTDAKAGRLFVYDSLGRYQRTIGRAGDGPGEFRFPSDGARLSDSLLAVVDPIQARVTILTNGGAYVRSFPTPSFPGRQIAGLPGQRLAVGGIYDLGRTSQLLAIYDTNGRFIKALVPAPAILLQITPKIDEAFLAVTTTGSIVVGSAVYPALWLVDGDNVTELPFAPSTGWNQLTPFPGHPKTLQEVRQHMASVSHIMAAGLLDDSTLVIGWHNGPLGEGLDYLALLSLRNRTGLLLQNPSGRLLGAIGTELLLSTDENASTYAVAWFGCGPAMLRLGVR